MRKFLTLRVSSLLYLFAMLVAFQGEVYGQFYLEISAPAELAGRRIPAIPAGWSGGPDAWLAKFTSPTDGDIPENSIIACDPVTNDLSGTIAIVQRGTCGFSQKVANVEAQGALGTVIVNNNNDAIFAPGFTAGFNATIPTCMIAKGIGDTLIALVQSGVTVTFFPGYSCNPPPYTGPLNVLWGIEGETGTFKDGLNGWTNYSQKCGGVDSDGASWKWARGGLTNGDLHGGNTILNARTSCDGAIVFDSDFLENGGPLAEAGTCNVVNQASIVSPPISLPAGTLSVNILFNQRVAQFQSNFYVGWSYDDGVTWDSLEINTNIPPFTAQDPNPDNIKDILGVVRLPNIESTDLRIKFTMAGNYYYWIIDDVMIIEPEDFNAFVDPQWMANAPYPTVPLSQEVPVQFMTDVHNIGGKALTGVELTATVTRGGTEVYTASIPMTSPGAAEGTVNSGDTIQNKIFGSYTPDEVGEYIITYSVSSNEDDFDLADNSASVNFTVTDPVSGEWGRENETTGGSSINVNGLTRINTCWAVVVRGEKQSSVKSVKFGVSNSDELGLVEGASAFYYLYEGEDADEDGILTDLERVLVGYNYYEFQNGDPADMVITLPILDFGDDKEKSVDIKEGKLYVIAMTYEAPELSPLQILYWHTSDKDNQRTTEYIGYTQGDYVPTQFYHQNFTLDGPFDISYTRQLYTGTPLPAARFNVGTISTKDLTLAENTYKLFPTNTKDNVSVAFNFDNNTDATMEVFDVKGNRVHMNKLVNQKDQTNVINVGNYAQGTYFVRVTTPNGSLSKPFNVIK